MIIVIEGADGSGKTTLYNTLKEKYSGRANYYFIEQPERGSDKFLQFCFWKNLDHDKIYIFDRSFITDIVYRIVDFEPTDLTIPQLYDLLRYQPIKIIYCYTANAYYYARERGETNITDIEVHKEICNVYQFVLKALHDVFNIEYEKYDFDESLTSILQRLKII